MTGTGTYADWIAVDWGTSNLRAWAMSTDGAVKAMDYSNNGMAGLSHDGFEPALLDLIDPWLGSTPIPVIACGMVGARQGWAEAPYRAVPTTPLGTLSPCPTNDSRIDAYILPGLKQEKTPDVMRGEETQIAGFLSDHSDFDGVICLPGTHTKWVHISAGEVVSFQTALTGELFALLAEKSVLRHSVETAEWDEAAFFEAVSDSMTRPETVATGLFRIRASHLLQDTAPETSRARLSGLLIGAEIASARPYWLGQNVALVGEPALTALYAAALKSQGVQAAEYTGDNFALKGLTAAYKELIA